MSVIYHFKDQEELAASWKERAADLRGFAKNMSPRSLEHRGHIEAAATFEYCAHMLKNSVFGKVK